MYSDHCPITLDIDFSKFNRGRGFWKFNNSLLKDPSYLALIENVIKRVTIQYAVVDGRSNFFLDSDPQVYEEFESIQTPESLQTLEIMLNPELFLDTLLMEIRGATIKFSAIKKRIEWLASNS